MVIRQNAQRVPTRPILFLSAILAVIALALTAGSMLKSSPASHSAGSPAVKAVMTTSAPDAQDRNQQILQSHAKAKKLTVE